MKTYVVRRLLALILVALLVATVAFVVVRACGPGRPGAVHLPAHTAQERYDPHGVLHVLPNCMSPVIVQGSFVFAVAVLTDAALSFLGVGVPSYVPSWGVILAEGRRYIQQAYWLVLSPGIAIMLTIFGLNLFGDGLRDLLDPKIRGLATERQRAA